MRRFLLISLAIVLLLVVAGSVVLPLVLDKDRLLAYATEAIKQETGATLAVNGDTGLSIFPTLGLSMADATITLPDKNEPDLTMGLLQIGVQILPLLSGEVAVDTFNLQGVKVRIESAPQTEQAKADTSGLSDAQLDAFYEQRRLAREQAGAAAGAEVALAVPLALNVRKLHIEDATLELVDPEAAEPTLIELVQLEAANLNLDGKPIPVDLLLRLPAEQPIEVALKGSISIDQETQLAQLAAVDVKVTGATAAPLAMQLDGPVDLSRQAADLKLQLSLGETAGSGTLRYASFESPQVDATLALNLFDPLLLTLAGPQAAATATVENPAGGDNPLPLDTLRQIDTKAQLSIDRARFDVHTIENVKASVRAVDGIVHLSTLTGTLHGGKLQAMATLNGKHNTARLQTTGSLQQLDISSALDAMESETKLSGAASLNWQLTSQGQTSNELTATLTGPVQLTTQDVVLAGTSVEHMLCKAVALTNQEKLTTNFQPETRFETLSIDIAMANGKAQLNPVKAGLKDIGLRGTGTVDLLSQDISVIIAARLSPGLEELDRACRVSKRLTAIDWPVNCKGNLADEPSSWCSVDTEKILTDLTVNEGKRKLEKKAGKLLDKFFKK